MTDIRSFEARTASSRAPMSPSMASGRTIAAAVSTHPSTIAAKAIKATFGATRDGYVPSTRNWAPTRRPHGST